MNKDSYLVIAAALIQILEVLGFFAHWRSMKITSFPESQPDGQIGIHCFRRLY